MKYYGRRDWLRDIRKAKNFTQFYVAMTIGVSPEYYQKFEYGTRNPSMEVAIKLAKLLEFPVERLTQEL